LEEGKVEGESIADNVRQAVQVEEIINYGPDHCPAGPNVEKSDAIIIVEGRRDVLNLLKYGIKNVIAVGGTNIPNTVKELTKERISTAFVDGDRGGELILKELLQTSDIDFVARAPQTREVEEIPQKLVMKSLKNKIPAEQYAEMYDIKFVKDDNKKNIETKQKTEQKTKISTTQKITKDIKKTIMNDDQKNYFAILDDVSGSLKAVLLDKDDNEIKKIPVRELTDELKKSKNIRTVVFDGIITQRLLDIANNKNIKEIVGMKLGNVVKKPKSVKVLTKKDV
jgi:DNA primase